MIKKFDHHFNIDKINVDDKAVFEMMCNAQTEGVFQFESAGMRSVLSQLKPTNLEDLIAVISLYRPGPMDSIPTYIENRHHPDKIKYKTPELKNILDVTYGCMVYQEQVMQICRELAGYSYGRADIVRRAMAKKKHDVMLKERDSFVSGAVNKGVDSKAANEIFDEMISFASYAFNKAHAAAYAYVAYQTAWLKCHYPCEFFAALLTSFLDNTGKVVQYINECSKLSIKILPPHINESSDEFAVSGKNIHFSLLAIKGLGRGFIKRMIDERNINGHFHDFYDFCRRMHGKDFNRRTLENLIKCGAFDNLGPNRRQMMNSIDEILEELESSKRRNVEGQIGFGDLSFSFDEEEYTPSATYSYPDIDEFTPEQLLRYEKEVSGMYLSGHPMSKYLSISEKLKCASINDIIDAESTKYKDNDRVLILGLISSVKKKITKNDSTMAFLTIEDTTGSIEAIVFPKILMERPASFTEGNILLFHGRISMREDEDTKFVCEAVEVCPSEESLSDIKPVNTEKKKAKGLFLRFDTADSPQIDYCRKLLTIFDGNVSLYFYFNDKKEYKRNPLMHGIDVNNVLLRELRKILGDSNVIYNE